MTSPTPQDPLGASVPLGGIGAGAIRLGPDGHFRGLGIHNNRAPEALIPRARHAFPALRLAGAGGVWVSALQEAPGEDGGEAASGHWLPEGSLRARLLYPTAHYQVADPACPATVVWSAFAPIIPFDHEASTLPLLCVSVRVANTGAEALDTACLLQWENLCGWTGLRRPETAAEASALQLLPERAPGDGDAEWRNAVLLSPAGGFQDNADAEHCLAARPMPGDRVMAAAWDPEDAAARGEFWRGIAERGDLEETPAGAAGAVAVCVSTRLAPGEARRFDFVLAWYAPRQVVDGADLGNAYTARFPGASEVARIGIRHLEYYFTSVEHWQRRLMDASFPAWFGRMLLDQCHLLSTNTLLTQSGAFALVDSADAPETGSMHARRYASFAVLLLFPRFEETELALIAEAATFPEAQGLPPTRLGLGNLHAPDFDFARQIEAAPGFALSACRNYLLTGNLVRARALLPRVDGVLDRLAALADASGLPAIPGDPDEGMGMSAATASLVVAAFHAGALFCDLLQRPEAAARHRAAAQRAAAGFEARYWNDAGYYQFHAAHRKGPGDAAACHPAQLAGQVWADLLGLGSLFQPARVARALRHIAARAGESDVRWPALTAAHFGTLQTARGEAAAALGDLDRAMRGVQRAGLTYALPVVWLPRGGRAAEGAPAGHVSGLGVWHLLYALLGFRLDLARRILVIQPNLPPGAHSLEAPLFTPACLGWLRHSEHPGPDYRQRVQVAFDSPVDLEGIQLRLPADVGPVSVRLELPEGIVPCVATTLPDGAHQQLHLRPGHLLQGTSTLGIVIKALGAGSHPAASD